MKKILSIVILITAIIGLSISFNSCRKPAPPKAVVFVVDENGEPVSEARVIIKLPNADTANTVIYFKDKTVNIADTQWTQSDGKVHYDFKYEAVYRVEVIKNERRKPEKRGIGSLKLENDKTTEEKIRISEFVNF